MYILTARWTEPCEGSAAWTVDLTEAEAERISGIIDWLEEHAGQDYGSTLCEWELHPSRSRGPGDLDGIDAVLDEIALNSRHNETDVPGDYYGASHPDLEGR